MKLYEDINAYGSSLGAKMKVCLVSPAFHTVLLYRISFFLTHKVPIVGSYIGLIFEYINRILYSVDISRYAKIDGGFVVMHGMGIVIGEEVQIGKNCKILNGVNLGNKDTEVTYNQQPKIGNNVVIGTGAKCLGAINIGDNVIIGANAVVLSDIPENCIAVGIPAKSKRRANR